MIIDRATFNNRKPAIAIAVFAPLFMFVTELLRAASEEIYVRLFTEDGIAESLQAIMYFAAGIIALLIARSFWRRSDSLFAVLHVVLGAGLLFVAGEEISWGQRIFGIATPGSLGQYNIQGELNLHNSVWLQNADYSLTWFYIGVASALFYASLAWLLVPAGLAARTGGRIRFLVPSWYLAPYFAALLAHNYFPGWVAWAGPWMWETQEATEVLIALGALLFMILGLRRTLLLAGEGLSPSATRSSKTARAA